MSYQNGDYGDAAASFERAARYADKFSQHYLSLIHWHGVGVPADPVQAYIWADQAAERGSPRLLAIREKMWSQLTAQQQAEAADHGVDDYEGYGDMVAKPRAEAETRRFMRGITGSRIDYRNQRIDIQQGGPVHGSFGNARPGMFSATTMVVGATSSEEFYADNRIDIAQYWQAQDRALDGGRVEVGPLAVDRGGRKP